MNDWYNLQPPETAWLVDGLILADGHTAICGKPKAGKSTFVRNLIASVIKGRPFLGRSVDIPEGTGKVLYIHLDRKDQPWRIAKELKQLGMAKEDSSRIIMRIAEELPWDSFETRLEWLEKEVSETQPTVVIIDLLWQFVDAKNNNDYKAVLDGINRLQDALVEAKYKGALIVTLHGRKATNPDDPADDILGSTGQRGSFSTNIFLTRHRKEGVYTILSDQTVRDEEHGEIDETIITRSPDGTLTLGRKFQELAAEEKAIRNETDLTRLLSFISANPDCEMERIIAELTMSKKTILALLRQTNEVTTTGKGIKGDPFKYFIKPLDGDPQQATAAFARQWA